MYIDQTPLPYVSPDKYTFDGKGVKTIPMKDIGGKHLVAVIFDIPMFVKILASSNSSNSWKQN